MFYIVNDLVLLIVKNYSKWYGIWIKHNVNAEPRLASRNVTHDLPWVLSSVDLRSCFVFKSDFIANPHPSFLSKNYYKVIIYSYVRISYRY